MVLALLLLFTTGAHQLGSSVQGRCGSGSSLVPCYRLQPMKIHSVLWHWQGCNWAKAVRNSIAVSGLQSQSVEVLSAVLVPFISQTGTTASHFCVAVSIWFGVIWLYLFDGNLDNTLWLLLLWLLLLSEVFPSEGDSVARKQSFSISLSHQYCSIISGLLN